MSGGKRTSLLAAAAIALAFEAGAQPPAGGSGSARETALIDVTGYWVSIVTEDWHFRTLTPAKGDYTSVPLNDAGREAADAWNELADDGCKAYGPPGGIRQPGRLHVTWEGDDVLRVDLDAGAQTRYLRFGVPSAPAGTPPTLQGHSIARWHKEPQRRGFGRAPSGPGGTLEVRTTHMMPGYLRTNGVPYSGDAELTEYFDVVDAPNGDQWLIVTSIVEDPAYLRQPFVISTNFRREPNGSGWRPDPCEP